MDGAELIVGIEETEGLPLKDGTLLNVRLGFSLIEGEAEIEGLLLKDGA